MLRCGCRANAKVIWRRRGDTISAPMPETFSCERARTGTVGVAPHGAHVRRRNRHHQEPGLIEADEMSAESTQFFLPWPTPPGSTRARDGRHALRARLGALRTEPAGAEQTPSRCALWSPTATSAWPSSTSHGQARAGPGAPCHRDDDVPRDEHDVLAGEGGGGDDKDGRIDWPQAWTSYLTHPRPRAIVARPEPRPARGECS